MPSTRARRAAIVAAVLPAVVALVAYRDLVGAFFFNDDFQVLYELANGGGLVRFLLGPMFGHVNTARNALLALEHAAFGPHPAPFYAIALLIHAANAVLLQRLGARLTGAGGIAALVATAWAVSPMHAGTLTWCAAHGHALLTTVLLVLLLRLDARDRSGRVLGGGAAAGWMLALFAIATLYGTGFGVAAAFPLAALVAAPHATSTPSRLLLFVVPPLLLATFALLHHLFPPPHTAIMQTVMPALRDVLSRPDGTASLLGHLADTGTTGLVGGPFTGALRGRPWLVAASLLAVTGVLGAGLWRGRARDRRWIVAALLLALGAWGVVALGRGVQWATADMRGAVGERYHYAAQTMLALALVVALGTLVRRVGTAIAGAWAAAGVAGLVLAPLLLPLHTGERRLTAAALGEIAAQVAAAPPGATVRIPNTAFPPMEFLAMFQGRWTFPGLAGVYVIFGPATEPAGRRVEFVATDPEQLAARRRGGRIATLLVPP
ncbi:MAG: hypothetical protein KIT14_08500 [bacterium]|nr:hypothetical protein [bacterium]